MKKYLIIIISLFVSISANAQYIASSQYTSPIDSTLSIKFIAEQDAMNFYNGKGACLGAIYPISLLVSPLGGVVPALIGATSEVKDKNINCPRPELYETNIEYRTYYKEKCKKIKSKKAWVNYGIAAVTGFLINYTIISSQNN